MPSRSKSILFYALILAAAAMIVLKTGHILRFFDIGTAVMTDEGQTDVRPLPTTAEETRRIQADLERQRREIDARAAELRALGAEIDGKLETLREAEENILRLIREKENLANRLPRAPGEAFDPLTETSENNTDADEPVIIELMPADE